MNKKLIMMILIGLFCISMTGCSKGSKSGETEDTTIIRVAFNQSESHPEYLAMQEFGEKFYKATDGRYQVQIYPNAVLGDQGAVTEFVRTGALQMAMVPCSVPESYNADFSIMGAPYLYDDTTHLKRTVLAGTFDEVFKTTREFNFEVVAAYNAGTRNVYTDKPINTPEDLKGYKIRVMDSDTYIKMMNLMGGIGVPMAQGEVYTGIQQKVIEGGENSERVYTDYKHYEVSKYYSYTKHIVLPDVVVANTEFLDSMSKEDAEIFRQLMKDSIETEFDLFDESVEQGKEEAEANGAIFVYPDVELFRERCQPLLDEISNRSDTTKEIYEKIISLREEKEQKEGGKDE